MNEELRDAAARVAYDAGSVDVAEGLRDILVVLNSDWALQSVLDYLVTQSRLLLDSDACVLYRVDLEEENLVAEAQSGLPQDFPNEQQLPLGVAEDEGAELMARLMLNEALLVETDLAPLEPDGSLGGATPVSPVEMWLQALTKRYRSLISVPLTIKQTYYGSLGFYWEASRAFSNDEMGLAATLGSQAALAIENARLRRQAEQTAILQERGRLARDLHDSVTQSLYSLTLLAEAARRLAETGDLIQVESAIARLGEIGQQALKEMRLLVYELRPSILRREGLIRALTQRLETVERRSGVEGHLEVEGQLDLSPSLEEQLYHIIQEALNNASKHAAATAVSVRISALEDTLRVQIIDNGSGFDPGSPSGEGGIGLASMRERAERLGGQLHIHSGAGEGTRVEVTLPLPEARAGRASGGAGA